MVLVMHLGLILMTVLKKFKVQASNDSNGKPIYNDNGKVMKGPELLKPNLTKFL